MANTETIPTSHTNGVIEDGYDEDDKSKMRPADIDAVSIGTLENVFYSTWVLHDLEDFVWFRWIKS